MFYKSQIGKTLWPVQHMTFQYIELKGKILRSNFIPSHHFTHLFSHHSFLASNNSVSFPFSFSLTITYLLFYSYIFYFLPFLFPQSVPSTGPPMKPTFPFSSRFSVLVHSLHIFRLSSSLPAQVSKNLMLFFSSQYFI